MSRPSLLVFITLALFITLCLSSSVSVVSAQTRTIYSCVKENKVAFSNAGKVAVFIEKIRSGVVNMSLGTSPNRNPTTVANFYKQIGLARVTSVIEVNDSYTNVYVAFSNPETADKVLEAVNSESYNPIKETKMVMATNQEPPVPYAESRHVLFGAVVAIATIFSAGLSAFIVRRLAIRKHEKANQATKQMANLESQLIEEQMKKLNNAPKKGKEVAGATGRNNSKFGGGGNAIDLDNTGPPQDPYSPMRTQEFPGQDYGDQEDTADEQEDLMMASPRNNRNGSTRRSSVAGGRDDRRRGGSSSGGRNRTDTRSGSRGGGGGDRNHNNQPPRSSYAGSEYTSHTRRSSRRRGGESDYGDEQDSFFDEEESNIYTDAGRSSRRNRR